MPGLDGHKSIAEVARLSRGYPALIRRLCEHYGIPTVRRDRYRFVADVHVNELIFWVHEWKRRPRLSGRTPVTPPLQIMVTQTF
jgi:hypothetical protein